MESSPLSDKRGGPQLSTRIHGASVDAVTGLACIAVWAGTWTLLDEYKVPEVPAGCLAIGVLMFLSMCHVSFIIDGFLQRRCSPESTAYAALTHTWTLLLALLSLSVWRMGFFLLGKTLLQQDDAANEFMFLLLSGVWLVVCGRLASVIAPPAAFALDTPMPSFMDANSSGHQVLQFVDDLLMTIPVIIFWDTLWRLSDQFALGYSLPVKGICSLCTIFCMCAANLSGHIHDACRGAPPVLARVVAILWTCALGVLSVWVWRGFWTFLPFTISAVHKDHSITLHEATLVEMLVPCIMIFSGLVVLLGAGRIRSLAFPPVSTALDDHELVAACPTPRSASF